MEGKASYLEVLDALQKNTNYISTATDLNQMKSKNAIKAGQCYAFPVKEVRKEYARNLYIVEVEGREYAINMYPCQLKDPMPSTLSCLVQEIREGIPQLVQDIAPLLARYYEVGQDYPFTVSSDRTDQPNGHYVVADSYGFQFWLFTKTRLRIRQAITCRVIDRQANHLKLELQEEKENAERLRCYSWSDLEPYGVTQELKEQIENCYKEDPTYQEIVTLYDRGEGTWLVQLIGLVDSTASRWLTPDLAQDQHYLTQLRTLCLALLEESDYLSHCSDQERVQYQEQLSITVGRADTYLEAIGLIQQAQHTAYIANLLNKLRSAGYLYNPDRHLRLLMSLFTLDKTLLNTQMTEFFDIIIQGQSKHWQTEPFRSAFVRMLELYIVENSPLIDKTLTIETDENREELQKMVQALSIQQLLAREEDLFDQPLRKAMLYRYATLLKEDLTPQLLDKAYDTLLDLRAYRLEYGWSDLRQLPLLVAKLSYNLYGNRSVALATMTQVYEGKTAQLTIANNSIQIAATGTTRQPKNVLPQKLLSWHAMQIALPKEVTARVKPDERKLEPYRQLWAEIERELFTPTVSIAQWKNRKISPSIGDEVTIYVEKALHTPGLFKAVIQDDTYAGEGTLSAQHIYRYPFKNLALSWFQQNDGQPLLFKAKVIAQTQKGYVFSLQEGINQFLYATLQTGSTTHCKIVDRRQPDYLLAMSEYAYSVYIPRDSVPEDINLSGTLEVELTQISSNGTAQGYILQETINSIDFNFGEQDLLYSYSTYYYQPQPENTETLPDVKQGQLTLDIRQVKELINLIDKKAVSCERVEETYNYLGMARMLARLIEDAALASYYSERMNLLLLLQKFAINGQLEETEVERVREEQQALYCGNTVLRIRTMQLRIISCLNKPDSNDQLWQWQQELKEKNLIALCRLVLSNNLLYEFGMSDQREAIRKQLNALLKIELHVVEPYSYGREDQTKEFKSSILYPADNHMQRDILKQTQELLKVVCGFLNANGGQLYIGVNDQGIACGLAEEESHFGGKDKIDVYMRNQIKTQLGLTANSLVEGQFLEHDPGKSVYLLDIKRSEELIRLDGCAYIRQGTSTWYISEEEEKAYLERRPVAPKETPEPEAQPQPQIEPSSKTVEPSKPKIDPIATSQYRPNGHFEWEEGYDPGALGYLHFMDDGTYMLTKEPSMRQGITLTLVIHADEADGYLVLVYRNGKVLRVDIPLMLDKTPMMPYNRYTDEPLHFVSIAKKNDALLTCYCMPDRNCYRMDDVKNIRSGLIADKGSALIISEFDHLGTVEIIPKSIIPQLKRIYNLRSTNPGYNMTNVYDQKEVNALRSVGIQLIE